MAYDEYLAERIRNALKQKSSFYEEKKMFGGLCFMVDEKMCIGIIKRELMVRINPEQQEKLLKKEGVRLMDFTNRPMKGYLNVSPEAIDMDEDLNEWVQHCLDFNPLAKASKRKK